MTKVSLKAACRLLCLRVVGKAVEVEGVLVEVVGDQVAEKLCWSSCSACASCSQAGPLQALR